MTMKSRRRKRELNYLNTYRVMQHEMRFFLHEIHSSMSDEKKWENEFNCKLFFSHGKTNYGTKKK